MMKFKKLALLVLTTCTVIVIGTGVAKAILVSGNAHSVPATPFILAQSTLEISPEAEAVNQVTIEYLLQERENLPQSPSISRTVIEENYALATWTWGDAGGQTALSLTDESWTVLTGGGGAIDVSSLEAVGVPSAIAEKLVEGDRTQWETPSVEEAE
ncbi:MAG: hypothetical protein AAFO06_11005 [Cyanobacteria bacterium J06597_16]